MKKVTLVNLTPHELFLFCNGHWKKLEPSDQVAKPIVEEREVGHIEGVPVLEQSTKGVEGLPEPRAGVFYIVSRSVLDHVPPERQDVIAPKDGAVLKQSGRSAKVLTKFICKS